MICAQGAEAAANLRVGQRFDVELAAVDETFHK
jgi:hypothetical protein